MIKKKLIWIKKKLIFLKSATCRVNKQGLNEVFGFQAHDSIDTQIKTITKCYNAVENVRELPIPGTW
jgi:sensor histidine kinase regulating citrate/malate metabolism